MTQSVRHNNHHHSLRETSINYKVDILEMYDQIQQVLELFTNSHTTKKQRMWHIFDYLTWSGMNVHIVTERHLHATHSDMGYNYIRSLEREWFYGVTKNIILNRFRPYDTCLNQNFAIWLVFWMKITRNISKFIPGFPEVRQSSSEWCCWPKRGCGWIPDP